MRSAACHVQISIPPSALRPALCCEPGQWPVETVINLANKTTASAAIKRRMRPWGTTRQGQRWRRTAADCDCDHWSTTKIRLTAWTVHSKMDPAFQTECRISRHQTKRLRVIRGVGTGHARQEIVWGPRAGRGPLWMANYIVLCNYKSALFEYSVLNSNAKINIGYY